MIIERQEKKRNYVHIITYLLIAVVIIASAYLHFTAKAANNMDRKNTITLLPGETYSLLNTGKKATYKSANSKVASVSQKGKIKAKKVGKTTITVKSHNSKTRLTIAVVEMNKSRVSLDAGNTVQLRVKNALKSTKWCSTRPTVVSVSEKGFATALSEGTATIKAVTDGKTVTCRIKVSGTANGNSTEKSKENVSGTLEVHFIDVGQADCILLKETQGASAKNYMIDCGNADDRNTIINYLHEQRVSSLDGLFLTHWHEDHIGSAPDILSTFSVKKAYIRPNVTKVDSNIYKQTERGLKAVPCEYPKAGESIDLGNIQLDVVGPCNDNIKDGDENKNSLAFILRYKDKKMFFGGDSAQENETDIINSGADLSDISVYKVSHHGSTYSTSYAFVRAMTERKSTNDPFLCIISVGKDNSYYHPHEATLKRLEQAGGKIYRTDQSENIVITTDGNTLDIRSGKNSSAEAEKTIVPTSTEKSYSGEFIGNKNSKVVHSSNCHTLPAEQNRIYFGTYEQAVFEGYRPCSNCLGGK